MPQAMREYFIHERGIPCGVDRKERVFPAPPGYVPWAEKWRIYKTCPGFNPPDSWVNGEPPELVWALLKRYPVAVPCVGDPDILNPRGSGYYAVVKMDLAPHSTLYKDMQIRPVIPCKEQLLNRYASEMMVEAWPLDTLSIVPSATTVR